MDSRLRVILEWYRDKKDMSIRDAEDAVIIKDSTRLIIITNKTVNVTYRYNEKKLVFDHRTTLDEIKEVLGILS